MWAEKKLFYIYKRTTLRALQCGRYTKKTTVYKQRSVEIVKSSKSHLYNNNLY